MSVATDLFIRFKNKKGQEDLVYEYSKQSGLPDKEVKRLFKALRNLYKTYKTTDSYDIKEHDYLKDALSGLESLIGPVNKINKRTKDKETTKEIFVSDIHFPFQDDEALTRLFEEEADVVNVLGDVLDLYSVSTYRKTLTNIAVKEEIALGRAFMEKLSERYNKVNIIAGNHDCFDDKTEILTEYGFATFNQLYENPNINVATLNLETNRLEYQQPIRVIYEKYEGHMIKMISNKVDLLVTPNHRMINRGRGEHETQRAFEFLNNKRNLNVPIRVRSAIKDKPDLTPELLVLIGYLIQDEFRAVPADIAHLLPTRAVQPWMGSLSTIQTLLLLSGASSFDQTAVEMGELEYLRMYNIPSKLSAFQKLCTEKGIVSYMRRYKGDIYELIIELDSKDTSKVYNHNISAVEYSGMVGCAEVPNDTLIVRRNGKVSITKNSRSMKRVQETMPQILPLVVHPTKLICEGLSNVNVLGTTVPDTAPDVVFSEDVHLDYMGINGDILMGHFEGFYGKDAVLQLNSWLSDWAHILKIDEPRVIMQSHTHRLNMQYTPRGKLLITTGCMCKPMAYQFDKHSMYIPPTTGFITLTRNNNITDLESVRLIKIQ